MAGWRRENSPGNGVAVVQTDVSVRALPKAKPETRIYKQVVCWGGDPRNYLRGMGSEAKKKRELMKGVWSSELLPWTSELNPAGDLCGPQSYLNQRVWKMGDLPPNFYQSLVETSICWHLQPTPYTGRAPEAQRGQDRAAGAGHGMLGLPTVNRHALRSPLSPQHRAGQGETGGY